MLVEHLIFIFIIIIIIIIIPVLLLLLLLIIIIITIIIIIITSREMNTLTQGERASVSETGQHAKLAEPVTRGTNTIKKRLRGKWG